MGIIFKQVVEKETLLYIYMQQLAVVPRILASKYVHGTIALKVNDSFIQSISAFKITMHNELL